MSTKELLETLNLFGIWYYNLAFWAVTFAYAIYIWVQTSRVIDNAINYDYDKRCKVISIRRGWKETFFYRQKYFTLYDLVFRMWIMIIPMLLGAALLLLKEGIWQFFPFLKKVFGFKLFRIEKEEEKKNDDKQNNLSAN